MDMARIVLDHPTKSTAMVVEENSKSFFNTNSDSSPEDLEITIGTEIWEESFLQIKTRVEKDLSPIDFVTAKKLQE